MRYHDGIMENYEKYYEGQMNELKTKVRAAVSFNQGATGHFTDFIDLFNIGFSDF